MNRENRVRRNVVNVNHSDSIDAQRTPIPTSYHIFGFLFSLSPMCDDWFEYTVRCTAYAGGGRNTHVFPSIFILFSSSHTICCSIFSQNYSHSHSRQMPSSRASAYTTHPTHVIANCAIVCGGRYAYLIERHHSRTNKINRFIHKYKYMNAMYRTT